MGTTASKNFATVFGSHSLAEAMLVYSPAVGGLKCSFHRCSMVYVSCYLVSECKGTTIICNGKILLFFLLKNTEKRVGVIFN